MLYGYFGLPSPLANSSECETPTGVFFPYSYILANFRVDPPPSSRPAWSPPLLHYVPPPPESTFGKCAIKRLFGIYIKATVFLSFDSPRWRKLPQTSNCSVPQILKWRVTP